MRACLLACPQLGRAQGQIQAEREVAQATEKVAEAECYRRMQAERERDSALRELNRLQVREGERAGQTGVRLYSKQLQTRMQWVREEATLLMGGSRS